MALEAAHVCVFMCTCVRVCMQASTDNEWTGEKTESRRGREVHLVQPPGLPEQNC